MRLFYVPDNLNHPNTCYMYSRFLFKVLCELNMSYTRQVASRDVMVNKDINDLYCLVNSHM